MTNGSPFNGLNGHSALASALAAQQDLKNDPARSAGMDARDAEQRVDTMAQVRDLLFGEQQRQIEAQLQRFEREFRAEISALTARLDVLERKLDHNAESQSRAQSASFAELANALGDVSDRLRRVTGR